MAGGVFFLNFKTSNPTLYLIGILFFIVLGIVAAVLGFAGVMGGSGLGIVGLILTLAGGILLIEFLSTRN